MRGIIISPEPPERGYITRVVRRGAPANKAAPSREMKMKDQVTEFIEWNRKQKDGEKYISKAAIEEATREICNHFCKFPEAYYTGHDDDNDRMIEERCNKCPLGKLI